MCGIHTPLGSVIIPIIAHHTAKEEIQVHNGLNLQTILLFALFNLCSVLNKQNLKAGSGRVFDTNDACMILELQTE